jgi:hypothetical protein
MVMLFFGAVVGCVCGALGYKFNAAAGAAVGFVASLVEFVGYDNVPALVDNTWGVGSCQSTLLDTARHAECLIGVSERLVALFWFLVGGGITGCVTYGILEHKYGEPE